MEKEFGNQDKVIFMKVTMWKALKMGLVLINGEMELYIRAGFKMVQKLTELKYKKMKYYRAQDFSLLK